MIPLTLQSFLILVNICLFYLLINNIRKYKLELRYSLFWLFFCMVSLLLAIFPNILFYISGNIYIETPVNALYLISFILVFIILYNFTILISKMSAQIKKTTQEIGLLKNELLQARNAENATNNIQNNKLDGNKGEL